MDKYFVQIEEEISKSPKNNNKSEHEEKVFKKAIYKSPKTEIEKQYDNTDPENCFKRVEKEGETTEFIKGNKEIGELPDLPNSSSDVNQIQNSLQQEDKISQLAKRTNQSKEDLKKIVEEYPEKTVDDIFNKIINESRQN